MRETRFFSSLAGALALSLAALACAPAVDYTPRDPSAARIRAPIDPDDVEVYSQGGPEWGYELAGDFQEESRDSAQDGRRGLAVLLRQLGAEQGCDGVILGGNVSRFEGRYRTWRRGRSRWHDGSRQSPPPRPLFEELGTHASCVVRTVPLAPWERTLHLQPRVPDEFYSF